MPSFTVNEQSYPLDEDESLLAGLIRHNLQPNYSCQRGTCQTCVVKITAGVIPSRCQEYFPKKAKENGFALACLCYPESDIQVQLPPPKKTA